MLAITIHDTKSGISPAKSAFGKYPTIERFCGDVAGSYLEQLGLGVDISKRIKPEFEALPKRWVAERILVWSDNSPRLSKDFEVKTKYVHFSHLHTLLRRY